MILQKLDRRGPHWPIYHDVVLAHRIKEYVFYGSLVKSDLIERDNETKRLGTTKLRTSNG